MSLKTAKYLSQLRDLSQAVSVESSLKMQFAIIVRKVKEVMNVDACSIYVITGEDELTLAAAEGLPKEAIGKAKIGIKEGITGDIVEHQTLVNAAIAANHPHYVKVNSTYMDELSSYLGVPFIRSGETIGVLSVMSTKKRRFGKVDEAFLSTAATHLSYLLHSFNAQDFGGAHCDLYRGVAGAPGAGVGKAYILMTSDLLSVADRSVDDVDRELSIWQDALRRTLDDLEAECTKSKDRENLELSEIVEAYIMIINSTEFQRKVVSGIQQGMWAQGALKSAIYEIANKFLSMPDPYMRGRGEDFVNIGNKLYSHLLEQEQPSFEDFDEPVILIAPLISVLQLASFDLRWVRGIVCIGGSAQSHTAIMAKSLGIPAVMGVEEAVDIAPADTVIVDGGSGEVHVNPVQEVLSYYTTLIEGLRSVSDRLQVYKDREAITKGGVKVPIYANIGFEGDLDKSLDFGAEGIGLFRSEFPFIARNDFPSESTQTKIYQNVLDKFIGSTVIMRTLDIGGDKGLSYMPIEEENPFLGWRGVRFTLDNSGIFLTQLRALLRASIGRENLSILIPMVSDVTEIAWTRELIDLATAQLEEEGMIVPKPQLGIMVEVPSIVEVMNNYHDLIDFISIGTNDLTQYLMAVDRGNPRVSHLYDSMHPAVLKVIKRTIDTAKHYNIKVGICGEMAADPVAIPLLVAMHADSLSMSPRNIPMAKWLVGELSDQTIAELLDEVLEMASASEIRNHMKTYLKEIDVEGYIRQLS